MFVAGSWAPGDTGVIVVLEGIGPNTLPSNLGKRRISVGWPSGFWITSLDEGEVPSSIATSEECSMLSKMERGAGSAGVCS